MIGRKLDQGILVQVVLEDTVVRAVHHVNVNRPEKLAAMAGTCTGSDERCAQEATACENQSVQKVVLEVPEIDTQEIVGEWLVPRGEVLLVSFGAHTVGRQGGQGDREGAAGDHRSRSDTGGISNRSASLPGAFAVCQCPAFRW